MVLSLLHAVFAAVIRIKGDYIRAPIGVWVVISQPGFSEYNIVLSKLRYVKEHLLLVSFDFHVEFDHVSDIAS